MGRALRADLEDDGIRVTTVTPGPTDTPGLEPWRARFEGQSLLTPEQVADAIWDAYQSGTDVAELRSADRFRLLFKTEDARSAGRGELFLGFEHAAKNLRRSGQRAVVARR